MTAVDLPTARLRQLRDGHDPDGETSQTHRQARVARLQRQVIDADEFVAELQAYRIAAHTLEIRPDVIRYVDRLIRDHGRDIVRRRNRLDDELKAKQ